MLTIFNIRPKGLNIGNDVIARATRHFLEQAFSEEVNLITLPATAAFEAHTIAGLTARTIYEINQYGHGVVLGGGNIYENNNLDINLNALAALSPPLMLFSLSHGRIYGRMQTMTRRTDEMPPAVIRALNEKALISLTRDKATRDHLHAVGATNAEIGGCPTLFLDEMASAAATALTVGPETVLVSVRNPSLMNVPPAKQAQVYSDISEMIAFLRGKGHGDIRILCHDYRDIAFATSFGAQGADYVYVEETEQFLGMLRIARLLVTYRLHSALPRLSFGLPQIVLSYDERGLSALDTVGMAGWNIDMVQEPRPAEAVADRYARLDDLEGERRAAQPQWTHLKGAMTRGFADFAAAVRAFQAGNG